jgi:hypothetical protein
MFKFAGDVHHRDDLLLPGGALPGPLPHGALRQLRPHQGARQVHRASGKAKLICSTWKFHKIPDSHIDSVLAPGHVLCPTTFDSFTKLFAT